MSLELVPLISAFLISLLAVYALVIKRSITLSERNMGDLVDNMAEEVQGMSKSAIGVGRKVLELEKYISVLEAKIEEIQKNDPAKVSYSEAARLVELGAGIEDLMNSCGISRPEAELVRALTENKHIDIPTLTQNS
jgi:SOS-response transcriptional repressor LexA